MSSSVPDHDLTAAIAALFAKLGPGIAGAVISLRFVPVGTSWASRAFSVLGGVAASVYLAPALTEWLGVANSRIEAGVGFLVGSLALVVLGEVTQAVHDAQIGSAARDWLRKKAGL
jgi:hypothetical protein